MINYLNEFSNKNLKMENRKAISTIIVATQVLKIQTDKLEKKQDNQIEKQNIMFEDLIALSKTQNLHIEKLCQLIIEKDKIIEENQKIMNEQTEIMKKSSKINDILEFIFDKMPSIETFSQFEILRRAIKNKKNDIV